MKNTSELLDTAIQDLECRLGLKPGQKVGNASCGGNIKGHGGIGKKQHPKKKTKSGENNNNGKNKDDEGPSAEELANQPEICKLEFKVGVITKVWNHPNADKLYCEEIDVGEESGPRQIASGLRPHFTLDEMMGQRLLVVANLKAKNLVKFKSFGMVLCVAQTKEDGTEAVKFVVPPESAQLGERVTFEGLPKPIALSASQVEKKKVFKNCLDGMKTDADGCATWNGHKFIVGDGGEYCKSTICNGPMR
mmetsp:Transcript_34287/g.37060  ORF Transcript_34287/g.37060 Transcript_34287/m.37060 type:complete len:249 (-) Transcript_34287:238-984(-)